MLMNRIETLLVNSAPRRWLQRTVEAGILQRLGGTMAGGTALEIGCGQGAGLELILDRFGASRAIGLDLDPKMAARAQSRLADRGNAVEVHVADAGQLDLADEHVDAVFDFAIIHHIADWRAALHEVHRVLRPGGRFYFVEVTKHALDRPTYRLLFDHPTEDRFTGDQFVAALEEVSLHAGSRHRSLIGKDYILGVAERLPSS